MRRWLIEEMQAVAPIYGTRYALLNGMKIVARKDCVKLCPRWRASPSNSTIATPGHAVAWRGDYAGVLRPRGSRDGTAAQTIDPRELVRPFLANCRPAGNVRSRKRDGG
jgi:hypothetical protein